MYRTAAISFLCISMLSIPLLAKDAKSISSALELQCPPCDRIVCTPRKQKNLKCRGGITRGVCNCCPTCARLEGETCGGYMEYLGKCDEGLYCDYSYHPANSIAGDYTARGMEPEGICRPEVPIIDRPQGDQPAPDESDFKACRPQCTAEFCAKNPRAICSARDNADETVECREACQHTSCRACRYVNDDNSCPKCPKNDDLKCIREFGTCIKQQRCHKNRFPCKQNKKPTGVALDSMFMCTVPECS